MDHGQQKADSTMWYWVFFGVVIFAGTAMLVREGLWSNSITLVNIIISGLVAFGFFQPIVVYLDEEMTDGQHTYWLDFAVLWALFAATMVICRALTMAASKTRLRFKNPIDPVGGPAVGLFASWVLAGFMLASLHTAPMAGQDAFGGKLAQANVTTASALTAPDAGWLRFVERMGYTHALGYGKQRHFSARAFVQIYADRRERFAEAPSFVVPRGR